MSSISPATLAWRARYYAFRNACRAMSRGDDRPAARELAGPHGDYVRDRLAKLPDSDGRIRLLLTSLPPRPPPDRVDPAREPSPPSNQAVDAQGLARQLEARLRVAKVAGYWPTPSTLVARMIDLAAIRPGERVLDACAGVGAITEAALLLEPSIGVDAVELAPAAREVLVAKQRYLTFSLVGSDLLACHLEPYDVVLTHPPHDTAGALIVKAFSLVRPGGRMVAIIPDHAIHAGDRLAQALRAIVEAHAVDADGELIAGGVGESPRLPARLYVLRK